MRNARFATAKHGLKSRTSFRKVRDKSFVPHPLKTTPRSIVILANTTLKRVGLLIPKVSCDSIISSLKSRTPSVSHRYAQKLAFALSVASFASSLTLRSAKKIASVRANESLRNSGIVKISEASFTTSRITSTFPAFSSPQKNKKSAGMNKSPPKIPLKIETLRKFFPAILAQSSVRGNMLTVFVEQITARRGFGPI